MKNILFLLSFLCLFQSAQAQLFTREKVLNDENLDKSRLSYGYYIGFNSFDFNFDYKTDRPDIQVKKSTGFNVGLIGNMRINDYFDLRLEPGLFITTRTLEYPEALFKDITFTSSDLEREVKSTYIHFPLLLKVSTKRINNFKPFIIGGLSTSINLSSNQDNPDDNKVGKFRTNKNMYFYEIGFGIDLYLYYFKFTPSIRGIFAINDELVRDANPNSPWTGNIESMKTRGVFINFTFQ